MGAMKRFEGTLAAVPLALGMGVILVASQTIVERGAGAAEIGNDGPELRVVQSHSELASSNVGGPTITTYPDFKNVCSAFVVGYRTVSGPQLFPRLGNFAGECRDNATPFVFSLTHENDKNNHKGSANFDSNIVAYMGDLNVATDLGRWVGAAFRTDAAGTALKLALDTVNYRQTNVTGWPLQFGHLFLGANDSSVKGALDSEIAVDADIRIDKDVVRPDLYPNGYSGHRVMLGVRLLWDEASPRTNNVHYLEIDLIQSDGYAASYGEPRHRLCNDAIYHRCFYSDNGQYPEGREVSYQGYLNNSPIPTNTSHWTHVHIPLSKIYKKLAWVSPPKSWSDAKLGGLYIGLESEGATQAVIELQNYRVYKMH